MAAHLYRDAILGRLRLTTKAAPSPGGGTSLPNLLSTCVGFAPALCCMRTCSRSSRPS